MNKELIHTRAQADKRTAFYLDNGWLTPQVAAIFGMYEDDESITDHLGLLDSYIHRLHIANRALLAACKLARANIQAANENRGFPAEEIYKARAEEALTAAIKKVKGESGAQ
jgi:hypothetical protein